MKKYVLLLICCFFLVGCGKTYFIAGQEVQFDERVDFRHLHYRMSNSFDYGSDDTFRSYHLYDKKKKVVYEIVVHKLSGSVSDAIQEMKKNQKVEETTFKRGKTEWIELSYKVDSVEKHSYFASYDEKEYYQIDFYNVSKGASFEKKFMKMVTMDVAK